ncbi:hypothetical protein [Mucilaginibacter sp.]|uniref:hypothetical protein n=1 Tax=Mucilaginibacter sp. TaxID=1882438 RepID=UPI0025CFB404|nr:hypothetical protein [Mucilaginibacter sp.]
MIYFKSVQLPCNEKQLLEKAMRKVAIKRTRSLDFASVAYNTGAEKLFLGLDNKRDVKFTRLHTSLEKLLPTIIISFPKDEADSRYRLRLGFFPTLFFALFVLLFLIPGVLWLINHDSYDGDNYDVIVVPVFFLGVFILLTWLELKIVDRQMKKAVERYEKEN